VGEFPDEARLADARLADDATDLAATASCERKGAAEQVQLDIAPDEA
jgi:hypothetical protein